MKQTASMTDLPTPSLIFTRDKKSTIIY